MIEKLLRFQLKFYKKQLIKSTGMVVIVSVLQTALIQKLWWDS